MDIPAHVVSPAVIKNHVQIQGGTNWDLARSAVETPIYELSDPKPAVNSQAEARPGLSLALKVKFKHHSAAVPHALAQHFKSLPKGAVLVLWSNPATKDSAIVKLNNTRVQMLKRAFEQQGFTVLPQGAIPFTKDSNSAASFDSVQVYLVTA